MNRTVDGTNRMMAWARLLPALALIVMQVAMTAMPVAASAKSAEHRPEVQALFKTLGVDRVVLCTPEGKQVVEKHGDHAKHEDCPWCQGFAKMMGPAPANLSVPVILSDSDTGFSRNTALVQTATIAPCPPSRAPPVLIRI